MLTFLSRNGHTINAPLDEHEATFLSLAAGTMNREEFLAWLEAVIVRKDWPQWSGPGEATRTAAGSAPGRDRDDCRRSARSFAAGALHSRGIFRDYTED